MPFWPRSGFADPYHRLADPDPDPAILVSDLQDAKKISFGFFEGTLLHLHHSSWLKCHKKVKNNKNQGFSYFFLDDKSTQIRNPDPNPDPDLYLWQTDLDPGGPKTAVWELH
jgi:hypothetical protein